MRIHPPVIIRFVVWQALIFAFAGGVLAQTTLDRLEQQIRQRVSPSREGTSVYRSPAAQPAAPAQSPSLEPSPDSISAAKNPMPVYLGVTADDRKDRGRGVRITDVRPGSPADRAGIRKQDLVTAVAGIRVRQLSDMTEILGVYQPADIVEFDIVRDGGPQKIKVTLGRPAAAPAAASQTAEMIPLPPGRTDSARSRARKDNPSARPGNASAGQDKSRPLHPPLPMIILQATVRQSNSCETALPNLERQVAELKQALSEAQKNNK